MEDINAILADVKVEGHDPFDDMEKETPPESPAGNEPVKKEPEGGENTPDDNVPFHKHPRWIERENELKSLKEKEEENQRVIAELNSFKEEAQQKLQTIAPKDANIPDWFVELYGDNATAWQKYEEHERKRELEIETNLLNRQEQARKQSQQEAEKWNGWVESEIAKLKDEGKEFDRNELIKTMLDYRPTDDKNNFDFKKGYAIYEALKGRSSAEDGARSQARKQIADTTVRSSPASKKSKDYMTTGELRKVSWGQL